MKKIICLIAALFCFCLFNFAWADINCSAIGQAIHNPFCASAMKLTPGGPNSKFCQGSRVPNENNLVPNTFKYSAIKGCQIAQSFGSHAPCGNWVSLSIMIKKIIPTNTACTQQVATCNKWCEKNAGNKVNQCKRDCQGPLGPVWKNCKADTNAFKSNCPVL